MEWAALPTKLVNLPGGRSGNPGKNPHQVSGRPELSRNFGSGPKVELALDADEAEFLGALVEEVDDQPAQVLAVAVQPPGERNQQQQQAP